MTSTEGNLSQNAGSNAACHSNSTLPTKFDVNDIVMHFGREYYTTLSCEPERLHCFYGKQSSMLHCQEEDTDATVCVGLEEIHQRLAVMGYNGARVVISNIDCQTSMNGGILIFVLGTLNWPSGIVRRFAQTFLLAEQPNGYFVLNDIMRLLSEIERQPLKQEKTTNSTAAAVATTTNATPSPFSVMTPAINRQENEPSKSNSQVQLPPTPEPPTHKQSEKPVESIKPVSEPTTSVEKTPVPEKSSDNKKSADATEKRPVSETTKNQKKSQSTIPSSVKKEEPKPKQTEEATPSSWAKLAAVQTNRWGSGVVAESKGVVASIPVEGQQQQQQSVGRYNYRTNGGGSGEQRRRPDQQKDNTTQQKSTDRKSENYDHTKSIYAHGITGRIEKDQLRKVFEFFGPLKSFEAIVNQGIAFIEYETVEARNAALKGPVTYNNSPISVEGRRLPRQKDSNNKPLNQGRRNNNRSDEKRNSNSHNNNNNDGN